jgi:hypothetical protein
LTPGIVISNFGGFAAPYITDAVKDATGSCQAPMFVIGGFQLLSAVLGISITAAKAKPALTASRPSRSNRPHWSTDRRHPSPQLRRTPS